MSLSTNLHPAAEQLNQEFPSEHICPQLFSEKGRRAYFPKSGILGQSAEAKGKKFNATIGVALEDNGEAMTLPSLMSNFNLTKAETVLYAPSYGLKELRQKWQKLIYQKNPSLKDHPISEPIVCSGLTHALSLVGQLFLDPEDTIFISDKFWGNYNLIFEEAHQAKIKKFPLFNEKGQLAIDETFQILQASPEAKFAILLNFPNNPTGYTPTNQEADLIIHKLTALAESGKKIAAIMDDAYFGLNYLDEVYPESLFAKLAQAHNNILAIKIDGVTKEDYAWGERIAFITYGSKNLTKTQMSALEDKTAGVLRGNLSNCSTPGQSAILKTIESTDYQTEKLRCYQILQARFQETKRVVELAKYQDNFQALPFNSGYFMCIKIHSSIDVEKLRILLLDKYSTGVISTQGLIRVAFSSISCDQIEQIFDNINAAIQELRA